MSKTPIGVVVEHHRKERHEGYFSCCFDPVCKSLRDVLFWEWTRPLVGNGA